jgi:hypothetical protein
MSDEFKKVSYKAPKDGDQAVAVGGHSVKSGESIVVPAAVADRLEGAEGISITKASKADQEEAVGEAGGESSGTSD